MAVTILLSATQIFAQQSVLLNQSPFNLYTLSPAALGLVDHMTVNAHYRKGWMGMPDSPECMQLTMDAPLPQNKMALGLNLSSERAGIFSKSHIALALRYKLTITQKQLLMFGMAGGFQRQTSDFSRLRAFAPEELSLLPQRQSATLPDLSTGFLYRYKTLTVTASANQLLNTNFIFSEPVFDYRLQYKPVSYYVVSIQKVFRARKLTLMPHLTLRSTHGMPVQLDASATAGYSEVLYLTLGYRQDNAYYAGLSCRLSGAVSVRYFYEYAGALQSVAGGGHEVGLAFSFGKSAPSSNSTARSVGKEDEEILEKIDQYDEQVRKLRQRTDSLDRNLLRLMSEIDRLKNQQLSAEEITSIIDHYFDRPGKGRSLDSLKAGDKKRTFRVIRTDTTEASDQPGGSYHVVLGVYQLSLYAREFQKILKRELGMETALVQIPDQPKEYIYVCEAAPSSNLKSALSALRALNGRLSAKETEITKGKPWILQITHE